MARGGFGETALPLPRMKRRGRLARSQLAGSPVYLSLPGSRSRQYKLYSDGKFFDVRADAMEKQPMKNPERKAAQVRKQLEAAMKKVGYPKK